MKKKYILIMEFDTEIREQVSKGFGTSKVDRFYAALLKEVLKNDKAIRDLYCFLLRSDLSDGNHVFDMDQHILNVPYQDEVEILTPLLYSLPEDAKTYFLEIFKSGGEDKDDFFEKLFDKLDNLKVTRANFMERGKNLKPKVI